MTDPATPGSADTLTISEVSRSFSERHVLEGVSLRAEPGEIVTIYGANGSGKTTLLRIVAGVLQPDSGNVVVAGAVPGRGRSFFVPAGDRMLNWRLTGRQNLEFYGRIWGLRRPELTSEVGRAAAAVGPPELLEGAAGDRSTGQRRRLMIATGLLSRAPVLLLDEPFADLDDDGRTLVAEAIRGRADDGSVVVVATPHAEDAPLADRAFSLEAGVLRTMT